MLLRTYYVESNKISEKLNQATQAGRYSETAFSRTCVISWTEYADFTVESCRMARRFALVQLGTTGVSLLIRAVVHQLNPVDAIPGICLAAIEYGLIGLVVGRIAEQVVVESVGGLAESRLRELHMFHESLHEARS